jgi:hypothetical protein
MKLKLEIELEYDPVIMHGTDGDSIMWFINKVLKNPDEGEGLILHSNCIGDSLGMCRVTRLITDMTNNERTRAEGVE